MPAEGLSPGALPSGGLSDSGLLKLYAAGRPAEAASPWVSFNFVASIDGAATVDGRSGTLGNAADQHIFQLLRRHADVILVGAQTIRTEGYGGQLLSKQAQKWRREHGLVPHPPLAIVSGSLDLDPRLPVFHDAPATPYVFTTAAAPADRRAALSGVAQVMDAGAEALDAGTLLALLSSLGMPRIHSEGGPTLLGTFQAAGLVDELCLTVSPLLAGGSARRISHVHPGAAHATGPQRMELAHILKAESMLFLRYLRPRP
ncbi:pyrimidine reductase family protein [Arthrobacter silviterrae]|uniref:Pyrimidine reductase family protein n=1 Tax=Arthrobacter silviterrae TaxID=2026658 RepID=A0ABX0DAJ5_9MICC|nr:pyrimidine reductase family protein [Arthrobacter silviterrae]